jgi:two-component sensor histidine kinase
MIKTRLNAIPLVIQLPVGSGEKYDGLIDLLKMKWIVWKDESIHHLRVFAIMEHDSQGKPERLIGVNYDITESVKSKLNLEAALEEKEILLRELYHRTKNNMQVICSMLDLEAMNLDNEALNASFEEMSHRIQTMSLVHNKLYQTQHLSHIDLKDYLKDLAELLMKSNSRSELNLSLETQLVSAEVVIDIAIPIGLVINELITNSLKYAFPVKKTGKITLKLKKEENLLILTYADNGIGFPEGFDIKKDHNLGLLLVQKLINGQLGGKLRTRSEDGCAFQMKFNYMIYDERV